MVMKYTRNGSLIGTQYINSGSGIRDMSRAYTDIQPLFPGFTTFTFTNAGATGPIGPTPANTAAAYVGQNWLGTAYFSNINGTQYFTIPVTANYTISIAGAMGGNNTGWGILGGNGAIASATFLLQTGDQLKMIVGQMGSLTQYFGGGGGGTFVCYANNSPIIIAGGGGGGTYYSSSFNSPEQDGRITGLTAGANTVGGRGGSQGPSYLSYQTGYGFSGIIPGAVNGNGGVDGSGAAGANTPGIANPYTYDSGSGGGGLLTSGGYNVPARSTSGNYSEISNGGISFVGGGLGGAMTSPNYGGNGGFGGGGKGEYWYQPSSGGGGGYSGGNGGWSYSTGGGGGSSYVGVGATSISSSQTRRDHGYITITKN